MTGTSGNDMGGGSRIAVTSDGTLFVNNRTGESTWGSGVGGNVRGGVGAITPLGQLLYGTTVSSLPTIVSLSQQYAAGPPEHRLPQIDTLPDFDRPADRFRIEELSDHS